MQISKAEVFIFEMDEDECILLLHDTLTESLTVSFEDTTSYCVKIESAEFAEWQGDVFVVLDGPIQFVGYNMFAPDLFVYRFEDDNATKVEWLGYTCPGGRPYDWEITDYGLIMWMMDPDLPWYTEEFRILQIVYSYAPSYGSIVPETTAYTDELYTYETFPSEPLEVREYEG